MDLLRNRRLEGADGWKGRWQIAGRRVVLERRRARPGAFTRLRRARPARGERLDGAAMDAHDRRVGAPHPDLVAPLWQSAELGRQVCQVDTSTALTAAQRARRRSSTIS